MPRPHRCRKIEYSPVFRSFSPDDIVAEDDIIMTIDEFECIRLIDNEGLTQEVCASRMNISRTTVTSIYDHGRKKLAQMLVYGKRLLISGGHCQFNPYKLPDTIIKKGNVIMRIAVTYENGQIFQHFGHTSQFKLYDVDEGKIVNEQIVDTNGHGHGALGGFLKSLEVDALICGGIGMGAQLALSDAGIQLYGGVKGSADDAAKALAEGTLTYDPDAKCDHHGHHEHGGHCGHHRHHEHDGHCGHHGHHEHHGGAHCNHHQ